MNRPGLIVLLLVATSLLAACGAQDNAAAGGDCLSALTNEPGQLVEAQQQGYCVVVPVDYQVEHLESGSKVISVNGLMDHVNPRLQIDVARLRDEGAVARADRAQAEAEALGLPVTRSTFEFAGETAIVVEPLPVQDWSRLLLVEHDGRLYMLNFTPADPGMSGYEDMEDLYEAIISSFTFIPATG